MSNIRYPFHLFFTSLTFILILSHSALADTTETQKFLRLQSDSNKKLTSLDTAIVTYSNGDVQVDLIGAVHIAEKNYYDQLNKEFEKYDVLLFELIAPENADLDMSKKKDHSNILTMLQTGLKDALGLEFQLDKIIYTKPNFVHADMTPEELSQSMQKRGESVFSIFLKILLRSQDFANKHPDQSSDVLILQMLFDPNRKISLRTMLAQQFQDIDSISEILDGPEGSTLLSERNKVALKVLQKQIAKGKKHIGIFYGAGHMQDMEKRLITEFHMKKTGQRWIIAWNL